MTDIKYSYALNEHNAVVHIQQLDKNNKTKHNFHCLSCGEKLIPRMGKVRTWHFAHFNNEKHCCTETYLHKLAKCILKEKFDNSNSFVIEFQQITKCSNLGKCKFGDDEICKISELKKFDLKEFYDTCQIERNYKGFRADLLLSDSKEDNKPPTLVEIQVSHKSSSEKIKSGVRIIEIPIKSEEDIKTIISSTIKEHPDSISKILTDSLIIGYAKFYGFKELNKELNIKNLKKFHLLNNGKAYITTIKCNEIHKKEDNKTIFELAIDNKYGNISLYKIGYYRAQKIGINVHTCLLCKHYHYDNTAGLNHSICCINKDNITSSYNSTCLNYQDSIELLHYIEQEIPRTLITYYNSPKKLK